MSEIPTVSAQGLSHCSDAELCNLEQNRLFVATGATPVLLSLHLVAVQETDKAT